MPGYSATFNGNPLDNAGFQDFVQKTEAALLSSGVLVVAGDTGQINPLVVAHPGVNQNAGFRIYKFADASKGQMYMKVTFGLGAVTNGYPKLLVGYGQSTNGAGTLTGVVTASFSSLAGGTPGSGSDLVVGGGGAYGGFAALKLVGSNGYGTLLGMTRLLKDDGTVSDQVLMGVYYNTSTAIIHGVRWDFSAMPSAALSDLYPWLGATLHSANSPVKAPAARGFVSIAGEMLEVPVLAVKSADATLSTVAAAFAAIWRDANHIWIPTNLGILNNGPNLNNAAPIIGLAVLFE